MAGLEFSRTHVLSDFADRVGHVASRANISHASLGEPARIIGGPEIEGVALKFLDLSSLSCSGTFKDWVACLTVASCLQDGIEAFVTQSSGNTANALALYGAKAEIELTALYPRASRYKINPAFARSPLVTLADIDHPEPQIKAWADALAQKYRRPWLPKLELQRQGNKLRAYFLNEWVRTTGENCDWHAQALSSAFGPIGTYTGYNELAAEGELRGDIPRFLGIQQEAVQPFATFVNGTSVVPGTVPIIEPTLFRSEPTQNLLDEITEICRNSRGAIRVVANDTVAQRMHEVADILTDCALVPVEVTDARLHLGHGMLEIAGLICLAGVLDAIEQELILSGESVLVVLTGGFGVGPKRMYQPAVEISRGEGLDELLAQLQGETSHE